VPNDGMTGDEFGYSIDISGNTAIVGAWKSGGLRGAAYVFRDDGAGNWTQIAKFTANDAMPNDHFGISVAIDGTTALVGAYFNSMAAPLGGAVYVFEEDAGTWSQVDKLTASDASFNARFGTSVALNGDTAVIGAPGDADGGVSAGAAYAFRREASMNMEFQEVDKLVADDAEPNKLFGYSVSLSDEDVVVGAYQDDENGLASGSGYLFKEGAAGNWNQLTKLLASDGAPTDALGWSVGISDGIALVGAPLSNSGATDAGAAYLYNVPVGIAGDYNQNGTVDAADYALWRDTLGESGPGLPADGNGDGTVNSADYDLWRAKFGQGAPAAAAALQLAAVPEPAGAVLFFAALILCATGCQRRTIQSRANQ
jgi:hypothetical protein